MNVRDPVVVGAPPRLNPLQSLGYFIGRTVHAIPDRLNCAVVITSMAAIGVGMGYSVAYTPECVSNRSVSNVCMVSYAGDLLLLTTCAAVCKIYKNWTPVHRN